MPASKLIKSLQRFSHRKKSSREHNLTPDSMNDDCIEVAHEAYRLPLNYETASKRNVIHRGMDRIRRSIRESFRRRPKDKNNRAGSLVESPSGNQPGGSGSGATSSKIEMWLPDEAAVREGTCSFNVKYLGGIEVFDSRGMQVCEGALKRLRAQRRHPVKAILYVSGDGLRVVDQENSRGLIVDQTIEKVSFCAPDRNHDKGFAYICRDGSSRRWMCHGFLATKESGERLSHAVGCAFAVCLEKKKKRDEEATLAAQAAADLLPPPVDKASTSLGFTLKALPSASFSRNGFMSPGTPDSSQGSRFERSNQAYSSFRRQLSITDRIRDPQTAILQEKPPASQIASTLHIASKPRPISNPLLFERQGSLRAPHETAEMFRRQYSLRTYSSDYPLSPKKRFSAVNNRSNEPIPESEEDTNWSENIGSSATSALAIYCHDVPYKSGTGDCINSPMSASQPPLNVMFPSATSTYSGTQSSVTNSVNSAYLQSANGYESPAGVTTYPARSRADEWLEKTLKTSLSIGSSLKSPDTDTKLSASSAVSLGLSSDQQPPISSPEMQSSPPNPKQQFKKFDSDFSKYSLPPITESFTVLSENVKVGRNSFSNNIDLFGQPVFNPQSTSPYKTSKELSQSNGSLNNYFGEKAGDFDPFDVKWSESVINSSSSCQHTPVKSTNPFFNELNAVKIQ